MQGSAPDKPAVRPDRDRVRGRDALGAFVKTILSFVLFLLCTVAIGDLCFPVLERCPDRPWLRVLVVVAHVLAGAAFLEGMRALWGRAVARIVCAIGFAWFLLLLVTAGFDPRLPGIFGAIYGILALYYPFRLVLLCRRPRPTKEPSARPS